jgi:hypothetical protein
MDTGGINFIIFSPTLNTVLSQESKDFVKGEKHDFSSLLTYFFPQYTDREGGAIITRPKGERIPYIFP